MPSSNNNSRKQRHARRQQRLAEAANSHYHQDIAASPTPYHDSVVPPPPPPQNSLSQDQRAISDLTMDERSVFEYSDTSDDADAYFRADYGGSPSLLDNLGKHPSGINHGIESQRSRTKSGHSDRSSGESAFRELKQIGSKSTKFVRFSPRRSKEAIDVDDEDTSVFTTLTATDSSAIDRKPQKDPIFGSFLKSVVHAFNTPSGIHHKRDGSRKLGAEGTKQESRGHKRQISHTVTEYPFSMVNLRDASHQIAFKDANRMALEQRPLLGSSPPKVYGMQEIGPHDGDLKQGFSVGSSLSESESGWFAKSTSNSISSASGSFPLNETTSIWESSRKNVSVIQSRFKAAKVAAYFLMDYEASRIATLPSTFETITEDQLFLYRFYFSWHWRYFVNLAIVLLFLSHTNDLLTTAIMTTCVIVVLAVEIHVRESMYGTRLHLDTKHPDRKLVRPMAAFLFILGIETWMWYFFSPESGKYASNPPLFSSFLKPLVVFYVSAKARHSLEAILRIGDIVVRVLFIEFFLILMFASVAYRMFGNHFEDFVDIQTSWISLFMLSTTVNNPSVWMPVYATNPSTSIFFVIFIIMCVFYYHSLVLSVVFQTYIQAITEIHERTAADRDDAIRLAFLALLKDGQSDYISTSSVRKCLQVVRPHYNTLKMNALLEIVDPSNEQIIDYPAFRNKIRRALNSSVRTARTATPLAMGVEVIAVFVAGANFIYVTGKNVHADGEENMWFVSQGYIGSILTILGLLELTIRFNPLKVPNFAPITRLDVFFDGTALIAGLVSCYGILQYANGDEALIASGDVFDYLHLGRAIDLIRVMRFFPIFRDVVRRSSDVLPTLAGPLMLFLSVIHTFVYLGIVIWGGAIDTEVLNSNEALTPLYCLNNFNSYTEGLITMFNVAVVNDWHAIAKVYTFAERHSSEIIVYPFFVTAICFMVFLMVNVIIAFFVEAFVTKTNEPLDENHHSEEENTSSKRRSSFRIQNRENTNVRRVRSTDDFSHIFKDDEEDQDNQDIDPSDLNSVHSNTSSTNTETFAAFDIYEREGFDQIMRTVAGASDDEQEAFARSVCDYLERFESLTSGREKVGYMVCCQQSMNRFGNHRFQSLARSFVTNEMLHKVVSDMHSELLVLTSMTRTKNFGNRCLVRTFPQQTGRVDGQHLEIAATLLRHQPAATLFTSRIRPNQTTKSK